MNSQPNSLDIENQMIANVSIDMIHCFFLFYLGMESSRDAWLASKKFVASSASFQLYIALFGHITACSLSLPCTFTIASAKVSLSTTLLLLEKLNSVLVLKASNSSTQSVGR